MIGQAHMEPLAYANQHREFSLLRRAESQSDAFTSVLSSIHSRHMDRLFFHVHPLHELVAKLRVRNLELVARVASIFRLGGACHVLHRLVRIGPPLYPSSP